MRLMLHYRGPLKSNGTAAHKHDLRRHFHAQLKTVWSQRPMSEQPELLKPRKRNGDYSLLRQVGGFTFVPLVSEEMNVVVDLSVTILRPEPPGGLITQGGDIDNRLKTLFDALTMPRENGLSANIAPTTDETPFYCLLEDDNLVVSVSVRTEQLLEPVNDKSLVDASIYVQSRVTRRTMGNHSFG